MLDTFFRNVWPWKWSTGLSTPRLQSFRRRCLHFKGRFQLYIPTVRRWKGLGVSFIWRSEPWEPGRFWNNHSMRSNMERTWKNICRKKGVKTDHFVRDWVSWWGGETPHFSLFKLFEAPNSRAAPQDFFWTTGFLAAEICFKKVLRWWPNFLKCDWWSCDEMSRYESGMSRFFLILFQ